jgi:hypothetical protein
MKLQEYKDTPCEIKNAAFVTARKDWLSILLHDWYIGMLDDLIDEYLAKTDLDIFQTPDADIATGFAQFAREKGR